MHPASPSFVLHALPIASFLFIIVIFGEEYKLWSSLFSPAFHHFMSLRSKYSLQHPVLKHPYSVFLNVRDQFSYPYRTTGEIIVLYILIFMCLDVRKMILDWMVESITRIPSPIISSWIKFYLLLPFPKLDMKRELFKNMKNFPFVNCVDCGQVFPAWFTYEGGD
jgi:hypothetical protein